MKETVLEIVQDVLSEMGSDLVNSIDDSPEAQRVALMLKSVYFDLIDQRTFAQHKRLVPLDSSGDSEYPNYLQLPSETKETYWVQYDCSNVDTDRSQWKSIQYLYPDEFIQKVNQRNDTEDYIDTVTDWDGTTLLIRNDQAPSYWTSFDDTWIVFDSYDSEVSATLQSSKSKAYILAEPTFSLEDDFVVDLPIDAFSLLRNVLKSRAFENIKQMTSQSVAIEAQRQRARMSRKNSKAMGGVRYPSYGRKAGRSLNSTFKQDRD